MSVPDDGRTLALLQEALGVAVPLWIEDLQQVPFEDRQARAQRAAQIVASEGDNLLFRARQRGKTARAFNALAEGIAVLAFQPGGVTVFGLHFEVPTA